MSANSGQRSTSWAWRFYGHIFAVAAIAYGFQRLLVLAHLHLSVLWMLIPAVPLWVVLVVWWSARKCPSLHDNGVRCDLVRNHQGNHKAKLVVATAGWRGQHDVSRVVQWQ